MWLDFSSSILADGRAAVKNAGNLMSDPGVLCRRCIHPKPLSCWAELQRGLRPIYSSAPHCSLGTCWNGALARGAGGGEGHCVVCVRRDGVSGCAWIGKYTGAGTFQDGVSGYGVAVASGDSSTAAGSVQMHA